jgi:hypothetical protein
MKWQIARARGDPRGNVQTRTPAVTTTLAPGFRRIASYNKRQGEAMQAQARRCAYCDAQGKLTKEHLLPRGLNARSDEALESNIIARGEQRVISSEPTIADVCFSCNNGPLSLLDEYICGLYDMYFVRVVRRGDCVKFTFDFDLMLRWLLKTAYNFARARRGRWPISDLSQLRGYILGNEDRRPASRILLQLGSPPQITPGSVEGIPDDLTEAPLAFNRVGVLDSRALPGFVMGFLIALNSYHFYLLVEDPNSDARFRERIFKELLKEIPGGFRLIPGQKAVLYPSSQDTFQIAERSAPLIRNVMSWNKWRRRGT